MLLLVLGFSASAGQLPGFEGVYSLQNWSTTGISGGTTEIDTAASTTTSAVFRYDVNLGSGGVAERFTEFSTIAQVDGTASLHVDYTGFHAYFQAKADLSFFYYDGTNTQQWLTPVVDDQTVSGTFGFSGDIVDMPIVAGKAFGFRVGGANFDSDSRLNGTITLTSFEATGLDITPNGFSLDENVDTSGDVLLGSLDTTDAIGAVSYSKLAGGDESHFSIVNGEELHFDDGVLDHEAKDTYSVNLRATDSSGNPREETLTLTVNDLNEEPLTLSPTSFEVDENVDSAGGYSVGVLSTDDIDAEDTHTYTVVGGADQDKLDLDGASLVLTDGVVDFERQDAYTVVVRSTDQGGLFIEDTVVIEVANLDEAPTDIGPDSFDLDEHTDTTGSVSLGLITLVDPESTDGATLSITSGGDGAKFSLGGSDNTELFFADGVLDHESKKSYTVTLRATDSTGLSYDETLTLTVNDLNEAPTDLSPDRFSVDENTDTSAGVTVGSLVAGDPDAADSFGFALLSGNDRAKFSLGGDDDDELVLTDGVLDHEAKDVYTVTVRVTDAGGLSYDEALAVDVTDLNEAPTDLGPVDFSLAEGVDTAGGVVLGTLTATDPDDGDSPSFSVQPGADSANFSLSGAELGFDAGVLDFEAKATYTATLRVTDSGGETHDETVTLTVEDVDEDCAGIPEGPNLVDSCGTCDDDPNNDCEQDCHGDWGGAAWVDFCGDCVDGNTGEAPCEQDCNGDWGGTAAIDSCGVCSGGSTGIPVDECDDSDLVQDSGDTALPLDTADTGENVGPDPVDTDTPSVSGRPPPDGESPWSHPEPEPGSGCSWGQQEVGCASTGGAAGWSLALLTLLWIRRYR